MHGETREIKQKLKKRLLSKKKKINVYVEKKTSRGKVTKFEIKIFM
jgi:hypothetical protein